MKVAKLLHCSLATLTGVFLSLASFAQSTITAVTDSAGLNTYSALRGDTLVIGYDSAYILNKRTFRLYKDNYIRVQNRDPSTKKLLEEYEKLVALQDNMLKVKEDYYQGLKSNFDSLASTATTFLDRTDTNINFINTSLANVTGQINNIKSLLDSSLTKLKQENRQRIKIAIGGFTVGIGVAALIFLIAN